MTIFDVVEAQTQKRLTLTNRAWIAIVPWLASYIMSYFEMENEDEEEIERWQDYLLDH